MERNTIKIVAIAITVISIAALAYINVRFDAYGGGDDIDSCAYETSSVEGCSDHGPKAEKYMREYIDSGLKSLLATLPPEVMAIPTSYGDECCNEQNFAVSFTLKEYHSEPALITPIESFDRLLITVNKFIITIKYVDPINCKIEELKIDVLRKIKESGKKVPHIYISKQKFQLVDNLKDIAEDLKGKVLVRTSRNCNYKLQMGRIDTEKCDCENDDPPAE